MRKFILKNRQKRKYVKKSEIASSLASTQPLALGVVPLILMAIAFVTTIIMYNPPITSLPLPEVHVTVPAIPEVSLPKIAIPHVSLPKFTFSFPTLPTMTLPKITLPDPPQLSMPEAPIMPDIAFPDVIPFFTVIFSNSVNAITTAGHVVLSSADVAELQISAAVQQIAVLLDPRPVLLADAQLILATGQWIATLFLQTGTVLGEGVTGIGTSIASLAQTIMGATITSTQKGSTLLQNSVAATFSAIEEGILSARQLGGQITYAFISWVQTCFNAVVNALNAFVWFLGTPFRAIAAYNAEVQTALTPFYNFMGKAFNNTTDQLRIGGQNLMQSSSFVASKVEETNKQK